MSAAPQESIFLSPKKSAWRPLPAELDGISSQNASAKLRGKRSHLHQIHGIRRPALARGRLSWSVLAWIGFAITFVMRPLGGVVLGWVADRFGRKIGVITSLAGRAGLESQPPYGYGAAVCPIPPPPDD